MDQSFYIGAIGAAQQMKRLNIQSNNIANVNSHGYKAEKARFTSLFYQDMMGIEDDELPYGVGTRLLMTSTDFTQGGVATTNRAQDYMINGHGFFALVDLNTNEISFTRNGAFAVGEYLRQDGAVDENGNPLPEKRLALTDGSGRFVLGENGNIIEVTDPNAKQPVGIFDYVNYDGMEHISETRFMPIEKNGNLRRAGGELIHGALELSNADLAEEITKVIEAQRSYGLALKIVQTSDEIETTINNLR